jgi:hypothetical protein
MMEEEDRMEEEDSLESGGRYRENVTVNDRAGSG